MNPAYLLDCPDCGRQLTHYVGPPDCAPWICDHATGGCGFAFWPSELTAEARAARRPQFHDHAGAGRSFEMELHTRRLEDRADAFARGTSVLPEFVAWLHPEQVESLVRILEPRAAVIDGAHGLLQSAKAAQLGGRPG